MIDVAPVLGLDPAWWCGETTVAGADGHSAYGKEVRWAAIRLLYRAGSTAIAVSTSTQNHGSAGAETPALRTLMNIMDKPGRMPTPVETVPIIAIVEGTVLEANSTIFDDQRVASCGFAWRTSQISVVTWEFPLEEVLRERLAVLSDLFIEALPGFKSSGR